MALEYCDRLLKMKEKYADELLIVMRSYLEKPALVGQVDEELARHAETLVDLEAVVDVGIVDQTFPVVIGPCSIHDPEMALEYCDRLLKMKEKYADELLILALGICAMDNLDGFFTSLEYSLS
jgi:3-deoxy-D-arabino-heptulosonate 7-phosphate (DAHP) synthase